MEHDSHDGLKDLLQFADASAAPARELPADLAGAVYRLKRRRRNRRLAGGLAAVVLAAGLGALVLSGPGQAPRNEIAATDSQAEIARLRAEIARLRAEADSRLAVVKEMLALEAVYRRRDNLRRQLARLDAARRIVRDDVEEAAFITIYGADSRLKQQGDRQAAVAAYRDVVSLFPQTRWADVARQRLSEIENPEGEPL